MRGLKKYLMKFSRKRRKNNMKLLETVEMMNSSDFKERFKAEYYQLDNRIKGLDNMLGKYKEGLLSFKPKCSYELLYKQLIFMIEYRNILEQRAMIENIELGGN